MDAQAPLAGRLGNLYEGARNRMLRGVPQNTQRAYRSAWARWEAWAEAHQTPSLPARPEALVAYVESGAQEGKKASTITLWLAAIRAAHLAAGHEHSPTEAPEVRAMMRSTRRTLGTLPDKKAPIRLEDLRLILSKLPRTMVGLRDRALLLLGWAGALRRSEVVGVDFHHLRSDPTTGGLKLTIPRSKTDQEGKSHLLGIPKANDPEICPVLALEAWCRIAEIRQGPVFRPVDRHGNVKDQRLSAAAVGEIVKRATGRSGLGEEMFAGHSLRSGFATEAGAQGIEERLIANQTRHTNLQVLRGYIREGNVLSEQNAARTVLRSPQKG